MIGVILITHGGIGDELRAAVENMLEPQNNMATIAVQVGVPLEDMREAMNAAVEAVSADGDGVLILADIFGSTPCNIAAGVAVPGGSIVLTGVNLPMLVSAVRARKRSGLLHVAQSALEAGRHYIGYAQPTEDGSPKAATWARG